MALADEPTHLNLFVSFVPGSATGDGGGGESELWPGCHHSNSN